MGRPRIYTKTTPVNLTMEEAFAEKVKAFALSQNKSVSGLFLELFKAHMASVNSACPVESATESNQKGIERKASGKRGKRKS